MVRCPAVGIQTGVGGDFLHGVLFCEARTLLNDGTVSTAFPPIQINHPHRTPVFKKILIALVAIVVALVVVISLRPADFRYTRSTSIAAPPAAVFAHVNDLHQWGGMVSVGEDRSGHEDFL